MRIPHFFKAYCRLGLKAAPVHSNVLNIGVEEAPDSVLSKKFLSVVEKYQISSYTFPNPENLASDDYFKILACNLRGCSVKINRSMGKGEIQVVIGGDNCVTFSSIIAVQERMKDPAGLGYIQFDSHGECNKCSTSPTGNFHGMYMRPFLSDDFEVPGINRLVKHKIKLENVICFGNLDLDGDEPEFFNNNKIRVINREVYLGNKRRVEKEVGEFIKGMEHVHINFDIDIMDKSIAGATGIPTKRGFFPREVFSLLQLIKTHPSWSLDLVEVNPAKTGAKKTIKFAHQVLRALLN